MEAAQQRHVGALHIEPKLSIGLLDTPSDERYTANSFVIRRWKQRSIACDRLDGATTVHIEGLEHTLTDALVIISFASGQQIQAEPFGRSSFTSPGPVRCPCRPI
ncbi:MAG: hypothetical protein ACJ8R9_21790 [Steroidobacteraceae bacterium]